MTPKKGYFEDLYRRRNRPEFIHPDPLEFVWRYKKPGDMEIAGIIAASLAYGNVKQILKSVEKVLAPMGRSPRAFLLSASAKDLDRLYSGFKHRFTTGKEMIIFLAALRTALEKHGSLNKAFVSVMTPGANYEETIYRFVNLVFPGLCTPTLIPCPAHKSSFKRLNLFLRWMVRRDSVDPGPWKGVPAAGLIIPLDTHMHRVSRELDITRRKDTSMKTAAEITAFFARLEPSDPVKYDFCLTRAGIRKEKPSATI
ncbi:MAG TPA: TIGR02757 family protein [Elusimicrobiales bacterium]|nr:TIGR02757 family protein [Elusimicrobiales bacterium]